MKNAWEREQEVGWGWGWEGGYGDKNCYIPKAVSIIYNYKIKAL